jgi:hypothetical protein
MAKSGVAVEKILPPKAAKMESCWDALQTTFSDKNWMRRSAAVRVCAVGTGRLVSLPGSPIAFQSSAWQIRNKMSNQVSRLAWFSL